MLAGRSDFETSKRPRGAASPRILQAAPTAARGFARSALPALALSCLLGCSGRGNFLTGGPTTGQLKTSLAHAELQNQQLQKQVAQLRTDNRSIEDRLVREELNNGDLTARLDNARSLLRDRGVNLDDETRTASNRRRDPFDDVDDPDSADWESSRTRPAGRRSQKTRKPPFARIPGRIEEPVDDEDEDAVSSRRPTWTPGGLRTSRSDSRRRSGDLILDEPSPEDQLRWTSIGDSGSVRDTPAIRR